MKTLSSTKKSMIIQVPNLDLDTPLPTCDLNTLFIPYIPEYLRSTFWITWLKRSMRMKRKTAIADA